MRVVSNYYCLTYVTHETPRKYCPNCRKYQSSPGRKFWI